MLGKSQKPVDAMQLPKLDNDLKFLGDFIYVNSWDCYPVAGQGVGIEVFDRNTLRHLNRISIRECDDEQQDEVESIVDNNGKLHILTGSQYPDEARANYFVFDKKTWKLIKTGVYSESNNDIKFPTEDENREEALSTKSYQIRRGYQTSTAVGGAKYNFSRKESGGAPEEVVASFSMQGTSTPTPVIIPDRDDVVFIGNPDNLVGADFSLFREAMFQVNGFDETMAGLGGSDRELGHRLKLLGLRLVNSRHLTITYHLEHPRNPERIHFQNEMKALLAQSCITFCRQGLQGLDSGSEIGTLLRDRFHRRASVAISKGNDGVEWQEP